MPRQTYGLSSYYWVSTNPVITAAQASKNMSTEISGHMSCQTVTEAPSRTCADRLRHTRPLQPFQSPAAHYTQTCLRVFFSCPMPLSPVTGGRPLANRGGFLRLASIPGSVASPHRRQRHPLTVPARTTSPIHITPSVLRNANNASYPLGSSVLIAAGPAQRFNSGSPIYGKASFAACVADGDGQARPTDYLECWSPKWLYPT